MHRQEGDRFGGTLCFHEFRGRKVFSSSNASKGVIWDVDQNVISVFKILADYGVSR